MSAAKTKKSESRNSSAKKSKALAASMVQIRVFQNQTLDEIGGAQAFLRRISVLLTPEAVSRLEIKWYAAANKGSVASMLCGILIATNFDDYAEIYDNLRAVDPKKENSSPLHAHHPACRSSTQRKRWRACRPFVCPNYRSRNGLRQRISVRKLWRCADHHDGERSSSVARTVQDTHR